MIFNKKDNKWQEKISEIKTNPSFISGRKKMFDILYEYDSKKQ